MLYYKSLLDNINSKNQWTILMDSVVHYNMSQGIQSSYIVPSNSMTQITWVVIMTKVGSTRKRDIALHIFKVAIVDNKNTINKYACKRFVSDAMISNMLFTFF